MTHKLACTLIIAFSLLGCKNQQIPIDSNTDYVPLPASKNFSVYLTDAPIDNVNSVFVNISHVELVLKKGKKMGRISYAHGLGHIDLLSLQNGKLLPLADLDLPNDVEIHSFRLILENQGNYLTYANGDICPLKTPSANKTGIKIKVKSSVTIEDQYKYLAVLDFDAKKSIVFRGKKGCLLKPVIKVAELKKVFVGGDQDKTDDVTCFAFGCPGQPEETNRAEEDSKHSDCEIDERKNDELPIELSEEELPLYF